FTFPELSIFSPAFGRLISKPVSLVLYTVVLSSLLFINQFQVVITGSALLMTSTINTACAPQVIQNLENCSIGCPYKPDASEPTTDRLPIRPHNNDLFPRITGSPICSLLIDLLWGTLCCWRIVLLCTSSCKPRRS